MPPNHEIPTLLKDLELFAKETIATDLPYYDQAANEKLLDIADVILTDKSIKHAAIAIGDKTTIHMASASLDNMRSSIKKEIDDKSAPGENLPRITQAELIKSELGYQLRGSRSLTVYREERK